MQNWISTRDVLPTREDADREGCILIWHIYNGVMVCPWDFYGRSLSLIPYWRKMPPPPQDWQEKREEMEMEMRRSLGRDS